MADKKDIETFIDEHERLNTNEIALKLSKQPDLPKTYILNQINGKQKARKKLPEFYANKAILYPSVLSMEQCSSEATAKYKARLIQGKAFIDLTTGFGVDAYYFSKTFSKVIAVEPQEELSKIILKNFETLGAKNIQVKNTTAEQFLEETIIADAFYIDPSRRIEQQKVFRLSDCEPNIVKLLPNLLKKTSKVLIKTSPMLDIKQGLKELINIKEVHVVSVDNECKEVLFLTEKNFAKEPKIVTVNISSENTSTWSFDYASEARASVSFSEPKCYLYEPNASIMKAGGFNAIANDFNLNKLAANTHLYTSEKLAENFPGRNFQIQHTLHYSKKDFGKLGLTKANISTRNFPDDIATIKKKLKLKDGGNTYIFACKNQSEKPLLLVCEKI